MTHEEICTYEVAKLAKEKGFSGNSFYVYNNDRILLGVKGVRCWDKVEFVAPTQSQLQRWLREKGFGEVEVRHWPETNKYPHHYGWDVKDNLGDLMSYSSKMFDTYELALEDALAYSLKNLV